MTFAEIKRVVAEYYGLSMLELEGPSRVREIAHIRQIAMFLGKRFTPLSLAQLGERLGNRDHTTILYGV